MNISLYMEHKIAIQRELLNNFLLQCLMFLSTHSYLLAVKKVFKQLSLGKNRKYLKYVTNWSHTKIKQQKSETTVTGTDS